jgi:multimeric flavodoxin WrbA
MKVLLVNGSSHEDGCTAAALQEIARTLEGEGVEWELFQCGGEPLRDCVGCGACARLGGHCVFDGDAVNRLIERAATADGFVFGTPVYYAHPSGRILSLLDRAFYAGSRFFAGKPGAAVACARRAGTTASLDVLNKYFTIAQMPVVASTYWNMVHGAVGADAQQDAEGLQTMRNLARNMAWLLRCIECGRQNGICKPEPERTSRTNFIR